MKGIFRGVYFKKSVLDSIQVGTFTVGVKNVSEKSDWHVGRSSPVNASRTHDLYVLVVRSLGSV